jgi:capsular polysaccharide transport system permease protein
VNEISHRLAREQMAFAETEMLKSRERYQTAKSRLTAFQNRHKVLDPLAQAQATATLTAQLEGEIAHKEAELNPHGLLRKTRLRSRSCATSLPP